MRAMLTHFVRLLARVFSEIPSRVSSNWTAILMAVGIFVVTLLLLLVVRGWDEMKRQWVRDIFIGVIAVAVGWIGLFLWSTAETIYEDHQAFVTQSANLLKENAALKSQTSGCWLTTLGMKPPSFLPKGSSSGNAIVFFCDTDYEAPLSVTWDFDRPAQSISVPLFPDARASKATIVNQGQRAWSFVEMPSLLKFQPTTILVYGTDRLRPPMATRVTLRLLRNDKNAADVVIQPR
jgi:hypothetical protein